MHVPRFLGAMALAASLATAAWAQSVNKPAETTPPEQFGAPVTGHEQQAQDPNAQLKSGVLAPPVTGDHNVKAPPATGDSSVIQPGPAAK